MYVLCGSRSLGRSDHVIEGFTLYGLSSGKFKAGFWVIYSIGQAYSLDVPYDTGQSRVKFASDQGKL